MTKDTWNKLTKLIKEIEKKNSSFESVATRKCTLCEMTYGYHHSHCTLKKIFAIMYAELEKRPDDDIMDKLMDAIPYVQNQLDQKDQEIERLKNQVSRLGGQLNAADRESHHMRGVLNGTRNSNRNWY